MNISQAIEEIKSKSKKRKFVQSVDLIMNFKNIDFSKPDSRINTTILLPKGRGKGVKVGLIVGDELLVQARGLDAKVLSKQDVEKYSKDKKALKKLASEIDVFLCQADLMALVGKNMGQVLAPRDRMPRPVPATAKLQPMMKALENQVTIKQKGKYLPTIHTSIGTEEMSNEDLAANGTAVISSIINKLPNKEGNIKSMYVKTTMGPIVKVDLK
ncbi:MAG: 50S ribosomal protein L1 [Candidatus Micrarchaeota archaeon]